MALARGAFAVCVGFLAGPAWSQDIPDRIVTAFSGWMEETGIDAGQIAVAYRGDVLVEQGFDNRGPVDLASLSKAITASCVAALVDAGKLNWDAPVSRYLEGVAGAISSVTLGQLVTHSGGIAPDGTQGPMARWRGPGPDVYSDAVNVVVQRPLSEPIYYYNNENYAVLAQIISRVTEQSYAKACADRVFRPLGVHSVQPSPLFGRFAAWGGWRMELGDYARFAWHHYASRDPRSVPWQVMAPDVYYGLGMIWRDFGEGGHNHWHFGALCFEDGPDFLTFSVLFENGWGVVSYVEGCPENDWFFNLDQAIVRAVFE